MSLRQVGLVGLLVLFALTPNLVHARGYGGKSGTVMTPYGPLYNTGSSEWKRSGGNMFQYQELVQQKALFQQQQQMMRMQQQMLLQQKKNGQNVGASAGKNASSNFAAPTTLASKKKKRRTYDPSHPVSAAANKPAEPTTLTAKTSKTPKTKATAASPTNDK